MKNIRFRMGELFAGPGGLALGATNATLLTKNAKYEISHAWANDYDPDACQTYRDNIHNADDESVVCKDVRDFDTSRLPSIDCFAFGFPCNDFSIVGEKKGVNGKFGALYTYGVKIIEQYKPKFFIAENVHGLLSSNEGKAFEAIISDLKNAGNGYNLTVHLYKFEEYGVPQIRHRIIIVGIDSSLKKQFKVPAPLSKDAYKTCREAIESPPIACDAPNNELTRQSPVVVERLKHIKAGENVWNADLPEHLRLNVKGAKLSQIYKRLDPTKPAYTITGSGGGGTHVYHWKENRALTNRERARLQTFPDSFVFSGSKEKVRKQIGMAVPPEGAKVIFEAVFKTMAGIDYEFVEPSWGHE